jgi:hypothetical protein
MLQAYSSNITITADSAIPFNNVIINKGCSEKLTAPATIEIDRRGVYVIKVDGFGTGSAADDVTIQLYVNGVALPQAQSQFTTASGNVSNFSFSTLLQVAENNCNCNCYTSPTVVQVRAAGSDLTDADINIVVTKLC